MEPTTQRDTGMTPEDYASAIWNSLFTPPAPDWLPGAVRWHTYHLPTDCRDDFLSLLAIECIEEASRGTGKAEALRTKRGIHRIADRVRHRILTAAGLSKKTARRRPVELNPAIEPSVAPKAAEITEFKDLMQFLGANLSPRDLVVLQLMLNGENQSTIASHLGVQTRTVRRMLVVIRKTLAAYARGV